MVSDEDAINPKTAEHKIAAVFPAILKVASAADFRDS